MASSPVVRWGMGRQISDGEMRLGSPAIDWWRRIGRGSRRRAATAAQRRHDRGSSDGGEERGGAQQCAALGASMWPREDARQVTGRGGSAEGRARRWRSGGGRESSDSGDRAARLDQQATRGAFVMHKEELRGLWGRGRRREGGLHRRRQWRTAGLGGGCACARGEAGGGFL
jgi:hypothetical protein